MMKDRWGGLFMGVLCRNDDSYRYLLRVAPVCLLQASSGLHDGFENLGFRVWVFGWPCGD